MKNNRTFFAVVLIFFSLQSFASSTARAEGEPGECVKSLASLSISSSSSVKIYRNAQTQTEISAQDDEQIKAQVIHMSSLKNINLLIIKQVGTALTSIEQEVGNNTEGSIEALVFFNKSICPLANEARVIIRENDLGFEQLNRHKLLVHGKGLIAECFVIKENIREAFKAENQKK